MPDVSRRNYPVHLDRPRTLRLDMNAVSDLEIELRRLWGKGVIQILAGVLDGDFNISALRLVYLYALRHESPRLSVEQSGEILNLALDSDHPESPESLGVLSTWALEAMDRAGLISLREARVDEDEPGALPGPDADTEDGGPDPLAIRRTS